VVQCRECGLNLEPAQINDPCPTCGSRDRLVFGFDQATAIDSSLAARELAMRHYEIEDGLIQIFRITDIATAGATNGESIKLLEVNVNTPETGIMPLHFGPAPASGLPFTSIIVEVSPNEFQKIRSNELKLPAGWTIGEEFLRPSAAGGI
jgi:hypothetical protein